MVACLNIVRVFSADASLNLGCLSAGTFRHILE